MVTVGVICLPTRGFSGQIFENSKSGFYFTINIADLTEDNFLSKKMG
jgi:hypothetical protein